MTHAPDQRLESMLVSLTGGGSGRKAMSRARRTSKSRARGILEIVLWSALTNVILLGCFAIGWNLDRIKHHFAPKPAAVAAISGKTSDPLAVSRYERQDNELLTRGPQRQLKGPLQLTLVASAEGDEPFDTAATGDVADQEQGDGSGDMTVGPEDPAAMSRSPLLRKGSKSGEIVIGSFATVSMPGSSMTCLDTAYGLLEDAGARRDKLKVLAESPAITVARICAANGSLVVTCRLDQITISPRRLKPNETCTG